MSIQCPACKESIDNDSNFCDQCGKEIQHCTHCGALGGGPRCANDGKPMQPRRLAGNEVAVGASTGISSADKIRLRNPTMGIDLLVNTGDLLGRVDGAHANTLGQFSQISSKHLKVLRDPSGNWMVQDLGSTNGSFYNGKRLESQVDVPIQIGGVLTLGDIALTVGAK